MNFSSSNDILEKYQFLSESPGLAIPIVIILIMASSIGTFGNILILVTICKTKNLHRIECIFIANLACSDLYVTLVADPMSIVAKLAGERFFEPIPGLCRAIACACTISCINSLGSISLLSMNRYFYICHRQYFESIFRRTSSIMMCCCLYSVGLFLVLLNVAGIGDHSFDRKSLECIWDRMATYPYTVAFSVTLVWVPVLIVGFSYIGIFLTVHKSNTQMKYTGSRKVKPYTSELAKTLFIIYTVFSVCWIPYALIIVVDTRDTFPLEVHVIITVWAHMHPSINWLVYYFTNTKFEAAFNSLVHLDLVFGRCRKPRAEKDFSSTSREMSGVMMKMELPTRSTSDLG